MKILITVSELQDLFFNYEVVTKNQNEWEKKNEKKFKY